MKKKTEDAIGEIENKKFRFLVSCMGEMIERKKQRGSFFVT